MYTVNSIKDKSWFEKKRETNKTQKKDLNQTKPILLLFCRPIALDFVPLYYEITGMRIHQALIRLIIFLSAIKNLCSFVFGLSLEMII